MARYTTDAEVQLLKRYAAQAKLGVVEIGVLDGETTKEMSRECKVPIYGIDPIISDSMDTNLIGSEEKIRNNMSHYSQFTLYKDFSYNISKIWTTDKFDFVFIDGDHEYNAVKEDFYDWYEKLEFGGYVAFHDSGDVTSVPADFKGWPGCIQLVDELKKGLHFMNLEWIEKVDTINVFQKK